MVVGGKRRVYVNAPDYARSVQIALITDNGKDTFIDHYESSTRIWRRVPLPDGCILPAPTIEFRYDDAIELYKELHTFFADRGVRNKDESFKDGELAGTKRHLSDLRHLLKLPTSVT